ncbi:hypothetical protein SAMN05660964_02499 [Thiothrix caldifontis]|uniref:Uncharacterized protein n=1 Tax=Thiothrix caldifontis TaxID=525918 RepID=A0A1H4E7N8_9GAMM|nr:hypothetical protein [Thiothrix caldifontis]SEA81055.1 hypothetical protein SAMN05660964_02499 [Thiothrix caldifontis]
MTTARYTVKGGHREQMKRELIGLVIGTTLLMTGMAFLFSQNIGATNNDSGVPNVTASKPDTTPPTSEVTKPVATPTLAALDVTPHDTTKIIPDAAPAPAIAEIKATALNVAEITPNAKADEKVEEITPEAKSDETTVPPAEVSTGWIYAGQFANGKWSEAGLKIGAELPINSKKYALSWGATVREHPPRNSGSNKLGKTLGNLTTGQEIEIIQVKKSGSKGHVWLEIKYPQ